MEEQQNQQNQQNAEQAEVSAQCFSCKKKVVTNDYTIEITANNHLRINGKCSVCKGKISSFIKSKAKDKKESADNQENLAQAEKDLDANRNNEPKSD